MKVNNWKKSDGSCGIEDVLLTDAFWYKGDLYRVVGGRGTQPIQAVRVTDGLHEWINHGVRVVIEPDAEIHIGPHPAEAKVKKLVAKLKGAFGKSIECKECIASINAIVNEIEADDEQD